MPLPGCDGTLYRIGGAADERERCSLAGRAWPRGGRRSMSMRWSPRFRDRTAKIGIIGLGYVGLPLLRTAAERGFTALGFDIDRAKVALLNAGGSYLSHISAESIAALRQSGHLAATADFSRLGEVDAIILCVPTPLTRHREPDLSFIVSTAQAWRRVCDADS